MKRTLAVFFGGRSSEHDVSIVTGLQLIENADKAKYDVIPVYIAKEGKWYTGQNLLNIDFYKNFAPQNATEVMLLACPQPVPTLVVQNVKAGLFAKKVENITFDCAIPAMHGMGGEDGTLQGLFELANVPYAETGVLGSAAGMDKILMKAAFRGLGLDVLDYSYITRDEWDKNREEIVSSLASKLGYPLFVKPANLGSSIGISKATDDLQLSFAIDVAVQYDKRVLIEKGVNDIMELNCSALGYGADIKASVCEQPISWQDFLSFEDKYLSGSKSKGMQSLNRKIPAPIDEQLSLKIKEITIQIFKAFDCKGVVRIDYIFDNEQNKLFVNEINTIPGSFAFYLWEHEGVSFPKLIDTLTEHAFMAFADKSRSVFAYKSDILSKVKAGGTKLHK